MSTEQQERTAGPGAAPGGLSLRKIADGMTNGVIGATMSEHFPVRLRYLGLSFAFAVASIIGGAVLPIPALAWSENLGGSTMPLALILALGGVLTIIGALWTLRLPVFHGAADSFAEGDARG